MDGITDIRLTDGELADVVYCIQATSWMARTYDNDLLRIGAERLLKSIYSQEDNGQALSVRIDRLPVSGLQVTTSKGAGLQITTSKGTLCELANTHHREETSDRWVRVSKVEFDAMRLTVQRQRGENRQSPAPPTIDAIGENITLALASLLRRWQEAPICCPREAQCSSYPDCQCAGGIPV